MKKILKISFLTACFISCTSSVNAQQKDSIFHSDFYRNAVALDMFYFLNIFRPNFLPGHSSQMAFAIERHLTREKLFRLGSAISFNQYNVHSPSKPVLHNKNSSFLLQLGLEEEKEITPRWVFFYGLDILYKYEFGETEQGDTTLGITTNESKAVSYGIAPVMGVKFEITPRIFISTETDFELWINRTSVTTTNDIFFQNNRTNDTKNFFTQYAIPQNIYLIVEF